VNVDRETKMKFFTALLLLCATATLAVADDDASSKKANGPPFFLIDTSDQLCLGGEEFKRCSIDTLFFVVGSPGKSSEKDYFTLTSAMISQRKIFLYCTHQSDNSSVANNTKATTKSKRGRQRKRKTRRKMEHVCL
jgi:hypothetical protein